MNHGKCVDGVNSYVCKCPRGFAGVNCEKSKELFYHSDVISTAFNEAIPTYIFSSLFSEILECDSSPCLNEGKCIEGSFGIGVGSGLDTTESVYTCECAPGFTGRNCETSTITF